MLIRVQLDCMANCKVAQSKYPHMISTMGVDDRRNIVLCEIGNTGGGLLPTMLSFSTRNKCLRSGIEALLFIDP
jgi:hypothetical protein